MTSLAATLGYTLQTPVMDRTGLTGLWTYQLLFSPTRPAGRLDAVLDPADAPPISVALNEQLGLELQPTRGSVGVLVIESVMRPREN